MNSTDEVETITLGAGCFWCLDAIARRIEGITSSRVGYAGDNKGYRPTYFNLHESDLPGNFVEAVELKFRPELITLEDVLNLFFQSHDPTTPNQDGANFGPEYHSTIFYQDDDQKKRSLAYIEDLQKKFARKIVTSLRLRDVFYEAEPEHQDFYRNNTHVPYCRIIILPKLRKLGLQDD